MTLLEQVATSSVWRRAVQDGDAPTELPDADLVAKNRRAALLQRLIATEILPRLSLARAGKSSSAPPRNILIHDDTAELVRLLMDRDDASAWTFVQILQQRGATSASLYLGLITQAARRLGELWEDDRCDFARVTIGLGRLQQIVRAIAPAFQKAAVPRSARADTVLLLPAPGKQHSLGLVILAEFFQREGWHVVGGPVSTGYDAAQLVRTHSVDVAGFSIASSGRLQALKSCIRSLRRASRNRYLGVMVGGPLFLQQPELVTRLGADATAADAPEALQKARELLATRPAAE
jgi:methanogenic corrinoid protein MtbC1